MSAGAPIRFDGQVAIVTGAGRGLGRAWAQALAARGAKVVVNGRGAGSEDEAAGAIRAAGGEAVAETADVTDPAAVAAMVARTLDRWGRVDVLVNNAGFVRDRSFAKMDLADFRAVLDVHLMGAATCTRAVWETMLAQGYGRVVMVSSSSGFAGNFGQAAYAAAKAGLVGLALTLGLEGARRGVHVNCLAPVGETDMNRAVLGPDLARRFPAGATVPGLLWLASRGAPNRVALAGAGGAWQRARWTLTRGARIEGGPEALAAAFEAVSDPGGAVEPRDAAAQGTMALALLDGKAPGGEAER